MITLITGVPGAGKTLLALFLAKTLCDKENRPLFVMGVEDLVIDHQLVPPVKEWTKLEPSEEDPTVMVPHFTFPVGAVVLLDECQKVFRPRPASAQVPPEVAAFETHRHEGIDFFLVTQHPMLLDGNIRRLAGRHIHVMRAFGSHKAMLHEWAQVNTAPDKSRKGSERRPWAYPKEVFTWYKSAELHTHKMRLPVKLIGLLIMPVVVIAAGAYIYHYYQKQAHPETQASAGEAPKSGADARPADQSQGQGGKDHHLTTQEWLAEQNPRVQGLAYTAPAYDEVTKPVEAPYPATCMVHGPKCGCWSQQGTKLEMSDSLCRNIVKTGIYIAWQSSKDDQQNGAGQGVQPQEQVQSRAVSQPSPQAPSPAPQPVHNASPAQPSQAWPASVAKS